MRFHAKLLVHDGQVLCPKVAGWRAVDECARCPVLERLSADHRGRGTVECRPDVERPLQAFNKMVRG